ncbi:MAG: chitobiase/beta-hexosaminidase C-terminal domain-containing protein, partial [Clostridia bacterium]|nr:chitobiase/beta-hexosaminidase C-terminal domain-containing protein [Clostridia bacterium]
MKKVVSLVLCVVMMVSMMTGLASISSAATKVASVTADKIGGTYTSVQTVTLKCATSGAQIYYTVDGSNPTAKSTKYAKAITVDKTMTIKAIAVKSGASSAVASFAYTLQVCL